jgi:hypothetical protein
MAGDLNTNEADAPRPVVNARLELVRSLRTENEALIGRLRGVQIPQHVGMAVAGRALATDVSRVLASQVRAELETGVLGKRWEAALARASNESGGESTRSLLGAVAMLLVDQAKVTARYVSTRAEEWAADAYQLEGQASALEAQTRRLSQAHEGIDPTER